MNRHIFFPSGTAPHSQTSAHALTPVHTLDYLAEILIGLCGRIRLSRGPRLSQEGRHTVSILTSEKAQRTGTGCHHSAKGKNQ